MPFREPRLVERGRSEKAEHGLGAGVSMRRSRVCPLQLFKAVATLRTKVVPRRFFVALVFARATVLFFQEV